MKKFEYKTIELEATNENPVADFLLNSELGNEGFELIIILPFQKVTKNVFDSSYQHKVQMSLLLIFKKEIECQE